MNKKIISKIDPEQWYRISDIVKGKFILNTKHKATRQYIFGLIQNKSLKASNFSQSKKQPLWMVYGQTLIDYINNVFIQ